MLRRKSQKIKLIKKANILKKFLNQSIFQLEHKTYLKLLIILAPLLNFLSGVTFDLYTPSMPAIAMFYGTSATAVKNTVTATLLGFGVGSLVFGIMLDVFGRRRIILLGLLLYIIASFSALYCQTIEQLIFVRFIQGMAVSVMSVGARAIILDIFTGHQFTIALLYTSIAFGAGPIIAPFIGGILQYHFGWHANFLTYGIVGIIFLVIFAAYINESIPQRHTFSPRKIFSNYCMLLSHPVFLAGIFIGGVSNIQMMFYATVGAFIVENILHHTAITFGNTALIVGCCYLTGALSNRIFIKKFHLHHLTRFGFILSIIGALLGIILAVIAPLNLITLLLPAMIICYSQGFIYPNVLARSLRIFPQHGGAAISTFACSIVTITGLGIFMISHINVSGLTSFAAIFTVLAIFQSAVFFGYFKPEVETIA